MTTSLIAKLQYRCGDEVALRALIRTHLDEMDNADFFESVRAAIDDKQCVMAIARIHLELSGGDGQRLAWAAELFDAFNHGRLDEKLEALAPQIDLPFSETILHAAEHCLDQTGQINVAETLLKIARVILERFAHVSLWPYLHLVESGYCLLMRKPEAALQSIAAALGDSDIRPGVQDALAVNQGLALYRLGRLKEAVDHYERMIPLLFDPYLRRSAGSNLAMVRGELGQFSRALHILFGLTAECEQVGDFSHLAKAYGNIANLHGRLGLFAEEERYLLLGLESAKRRPAGDKGYDWNTLITSYFNLTQFYIRRESLDLAEQYFEWFMESARTYGTGPYHLSYARTLLQLHFKRGRRNKALNIISNILRDPHSPDDEFLAFLGVAATVLYRQGMVERATDLFSQLNDAAREMDHPEFLLTSSGYLGLCRLQQGEMVEGLECFDQMFSNERRLRDEIGTGCHQPSFSADKEDLYFEVLQNAKAVVGAPKLLAYVQHCKAPSLGYSARTVDDYDEIRRAIPAGVLIAEYFHKHGISFCLLAARDLDPPIEIPLAVDEMDIRDFAIRLGNQIPQARFYLNRDPFSWFSEAWDGLLRPIEPYFEGYKHLVVCPSTQGFHLPFHLFPDRLGRRLIERMAVSYTPNVSLFAAAQISLIQASEQHALVLASSRPGDDESTRRSFMREAEAVGRLLRSTPLLEPEDGLKALHQRIGARVVHIANHGRFDASAPLRSGLYLMQGGKEHLLPVDNFYELDLAADLVFLSGCDTGRVSMQKNEEPIGLLAPLLGGKTRSAILSFWPIPGGLELTVELVSGFYRYWLTEGFPRAEALRRIMLDHSGEANPYLWGGYGFYGAV